VNDAHKSDIMDADAVAVGSPNYNHAMMPTVRRFLDSLLPLISQEKSVYRLAHMAGALKQQIRSTGY